MIKFILPIAIFIAAVYGISYFWTNSNSKVKTGERVAVIALNKQDKKYPKANTKKTVIACLLGKI